MRGLILDPYSKSLESDLVKRLLNDFQRDFPLVARPFQAIAENLGVTEDWVLEKLSLLKNEGLITRVGPVLTPNRIGASTLAAFCVPNNQLEEIANLVSSFEEVNHNYSREHEYNLWFVVTAESEDKLAEVIAKIESKVSLKAMVLPLEEEFRIDLGFEICFDSTSKRLK